MSVPLGPVADHAPYHQLGPLSGGHFPPHPRTFEAAQCCPAFPELARSQLPTEVPRNTSIQHRSMGLEPIAEIAQPPEPVIDVKKAWLLRHTITHVLMGVSQQITRNSRGF